MACSCPARPGSPASSWSLSGATSCLLSIFCPLSLLSKHLDVLASCPSKRSSSAVSLQLLSPPPPPPSASAAGLAFQDKTSSDCSFVENSSVVSHELHVSPITFVPLSLNKCLSRAQQTACLITYSVSSHALFLLLLPIRPADFYSSFLT